MIRKVKSEQTLNGSRGGRYWRARRGGGWAIGCRLTDSDTNHRAKAPKAVGRSVAVTAHRTRPTPLPQGRSLARVVRISS